MDLLKLFKLIKLCLFLKQGHSNGEWSDNETHYTCRLVCKTKWLEEERGISYDF